MTPRTTHAARTLGALGLLGLALPFNVALTAAALVGSRFRQAQPASVRRSSLSRPREARFRQARLRQAQPATRGRTVMVSGGKMTKALTLCRAFHAAGHRVVLVESARYRLTGHRFSRAVDAFHTVPEASSAAYADALADVARAEGVEVYVPVCSPASSIADARAKKRLQEVCEVVHLDADQLELVDDKLRFARAAAELGLRVPDTHLVTDAQQVLDHDFTGARRPYILKSIAYDPVHRLDLTWLPFGPPEEMAAFVRSLPISEDNPWILQEFIEGREYCTHSTVREGRLTVYCCCESSAFQVNYAHVEHPGIRAWVERFVEREQLTGQVSLDFIVDEHGEVFAIECNPRTHSAITLLAGHPDLAAAYLDDAQTGVVEPSTTRRPTYWTYHELWRLLAERGRGDRLRTLREGSDAIFHAEDPLPFLVEHHVLVPWLLLRSLVERRPWLRVDFNIGKLVEAGGD